MTELQPANRAVLASYDESHWPGAERIRGGAGRGDAAYTSFRKE